MCNGFTGSTSGLNIRQVQRAATRTQLVAAARAVFEEKGYGEATIDDILLAEQRGILDEEERTQVGMGASG